MARSPKSKTSKVIPAAGWIPSLLGAALLVISGFSLGLVVGIVKEEPELVVGHLSGRSQEIKWATDTAPDFAPDSAPQNETANAAVASRGVEPAFGSKPASPEPSAPVEFSTNRESGEGMPELSLPSTTSAKPAKAAARAREGKAVSQLPQVSAAREPRPGKGFSVQVGAFKASEPAAGVAQELRGKGYDAYVVPASQSGKKLWRVRVGPVANRSEADRISSRLKREEKMMPFVLSEGGG
jgi:cell division septation protein DedD